MLGSLTLYRRLLLEHVFSKPHLRPAISSPSSPSEFYALPSFGHGVAGIMAGTTVSFIASPVEHIKARLQIQYAADKNQRMYSGPVDCIRKVVSITYLSNQWERQPSPADNRTAVPHTRHRRSLPRPLLDDLLPLLLLLLVGLIRRLHPLDERAHQHVHPGHQLLGRRSLRPGVLDHLVPVGCGEAAHHDGPDGWCAGGW